MLSESPLDIPEGIHGELVFQVCLQIDIMTEKLYTNVFVLAITTFGAVVINVVIRYHLGSNH